MPSSSSLQINCQRGPPSPSSLNKSSDDGKKDFLMGPPAPKQRKNPKIVLDEGTYVAAFEKTH